MTPNFAVGADVRHGHQQSSQNRKAEKTFPSDGLQWLHVVLLEDFFFVDKLESRNYLKIGRFFKNNSETILENTLA